VFVLPDLCHASADLPHRLSLLCGVSSCYASLSATPPPISCAPSPSDSTAQILLSQLAEDAKDVTLRLRLLHCWRAGSPVMPEAFFAYSTLWADETGARIEGTALPVHVEYLEARLRPKVVYDLTSFSMTFPRRSHRATSNNRYLQLTSTSNFEEVGDPGEGFPLDSFEFVPFGQLSPRVSPFPFLTG
ncbi:hypothetical protein LINPERHAP2_LOCUS35625, partial [Linum perenne]